MDLNNLYGEKELMDWLTSQGFKCAIDLFRDNQNKCNWYAYKRSQYKARACEGNDDKIGMHIAINPFSRSIDGIEYRNVEVEVRGEANAIWWKLQAYSVAMEYLPAELPHIEQALISAWNALKTSKGGLHVKRIGKKRTAGNRKLCVTGKRGIS
ncbi:MAG: hypothetical protein Q8O68_01020 [Candidatus Daviesbacteria bacterium]|nr:hypothetical protein [Candidatus Daviesbacteria bacterium]